MKTREKELKYLMYLKKEELRIIKKELMNYSRELKEINEEKTKVRKLGGK